MSDIRNKIESLLFIANKPLTRKKLAELTEGAAADVENAVELLKEKYNQPDSGVRLLQIGSSVQMSTAPESAAVLEEFLKEELTGEMTKPQLETLTVIAYRGPIIKTELEQIRGVNCSLILRNLLIRGLAEVVDQTKDKLPRYQITMDFLRFLGLNSPRELPDFENLSKHENLEALLHQAQKKESPDAEKQGTDRLMDREDLSQEAV